MKDQVIGFLKRHHYNIGAQVKISETIRVDIHGGETRGICEYTQDTIIIKRSVLESESVFLGVLIHEFAHYQHHNPDNSRAFENDLTEMLGYAIHDNILSTITNNNSNKSIFNFWKK